MSPGHELFDHVQGFYTTRALLALWRLGLLDELADGPLDVRECAARGLDERLLRSLLAYLTVRGYVEPAGEDRHRLTDRGREALPAIGYLPMLVGAYEPVFENLEEVLARQLVYGADVTRSHRELSDAVGAIERQLGGGILDVVASLPYKRVLDLGCGSGRVLSRLCGRGEDMKGIGVDVSEEACAAATATIAAEGLADRVAVVQGDAAALAAVGAERLDGVDLVVAMFLLHELLRRGGRAEVVRILRELRDTTAPGGHLLIVEVEPPPAGEARLGLSFVPEYALVHDFSDQQLASEAEWREILEEAGLAVLRREPAGMCNAFCLVATPAPAARKGRAVRERAAEPAS